MWMMGPEDADSAALIAKIWQHRFLTSDALDQYYSENANKEGLLDQYQSFMQSKLNTDVYEEINDTHRTLDSTLTNFLKNKSKCIGIVISEENEFRISKTACRNQYTIQKAIDDISGPLALYSVKAVFSASAGSSAKQYLRWIENVINGEKSISIIDKYILSRESNYECLINYYYPMIKPGCTLNIHTGSEAPFIKDAKKHAERHDIQINIFQHTKMHDRYITTSNRIIMLPLGCDFMEIKQNGVLIRKTTSFTMIDKKKYTKEKNLWQSIGLENYLSGDSPFE